MPDDPSREDEVKSGFKKQSVQLLLSTAKDAYDNEQSRTSAIDTKASIALPIVSAFFLALVQMNDCKVIWNLKSHWLIPASLLLLYIASLLLGASSVFFLARVIHTRDYKSLKIRDLYDENYLKNSSTAFSIQIIKLYCESSEYNKQQNDLRAKWYNWGWNLVLLSVLCFVGYTVLHNIFLT